MQGFSLLDTKSTLTYMDQKRAICLHFQVSFEKLDFLLSITFSWSDTAWYSDVVLPLSPYLARESIIATKPGPKPQFFVRHRAVEPRGATRPCLGIRRGLSRRPGL